LLSRVKEGSLLWRQMNDPQFFVNFWWNKELTPKQVEFLTASLTNDEVVFISCRQGGKTEAVAVGVVWALLFDHIRYGTKAQIECYAPTQKQAKEVVFERVRHLINTGMHQTRDGGYLKLKDEFEKPRERGFYQAHNGNEFRIQTASKDSEVRGYSPNKVIVEECGSIHPTMFYSDIKGAGKALAGLDKDAFERVRGLSIREQQEELAKIGVQTRYQYVGTPLGRNQFWELSQDGAGTYVVRQPWWECPISDIAAIEKDRARMTVREFEAEYCCVFNSDSEFAFPKDQLRTAFCLDPKAHYVRRKDRKYYLGIDLGQRVDHSTMAVFECIGPVRRMVFNYEWETDLKWDDIAAEMNDFYWQWEPAFALVDRTGAQGKMVFERYLINFGWTIEGYVFDNTSKGELFKNAQLLLERGNMELLAFDALKRQFGKIEEKRYPTSNLVTYPKPDDGTKDDMVYAALLALMAAAIWEQDGHIKRSVVDQALRYEPSPFATKDPMPTGWRSEQKATTARLDRVQQGSPWAKRGNMKSPWSGRAKAPSPWR